jgi:chemosensory pili system protein ChpA (sensor histidine kinase/response regulator)
MKLPSLRWFKRAKSVPASLPPTPPIPSPAQEPTRAKPLAKILIVDDDAIILKSTSMKLEAAGYEVFTAMDGSEALGTLSDEKPDLVLLDLNFPPDVAHGGLASFDGFQLLAWFRNVVNTARTKFIIISADDAVEVKGRALAAGAVAFFTKPIDHVRLLAEIQRHLTRNDGKEPV